MMGVLLAQCLKVSGQEICGPAMQFDNRTRISTPADLVNQIMPFLYGFSLVVLLFVFIWGGFDLMTSRGNPEKIKSARAKITSGIVGTLLLTVAFLVTQFISRIFGLGGELF